MRKVILNKCYGGFDVSDKGYQLYAKKKGLQLFRYEITFDGGQPMYKKTEKIGLGTSYFTKDLGNNIGMLDKDYDKYCLYLRDNHREDTVLIEVIEELGEEASGMCGKLKVVEIPDDLDYVIDEYDGIETLHERVQEW